MPPSLSISPIGPFKATIRPPGSKSLTNRALLLAALAEGESTVREPLIADDTRSMLEGLAALGFDIERSGDDGQINVSGRGGRIPADRADLDLGNAGTAMRPLAAACCLGNGAYRLDGNRRMRQRPIGELVDPLRELGAAIDYEGDAGFPPLRINGRGLQGGLVRMPTTLSSQYITALLMVGPACRDGLTIQFDGPVTSRPYVEMTLGVMKQFGVTAQVESSFTCITIPNGHYDAQDYTVEPDASSATYFLAAAAIRPDSQCTIEGLGRRSLQGDVEFADVLHQMGAGLVFGADFITVMAPEAPAKLKGIDVDLNHMPDAALTLAAMGLFCDGTTTIRNVGNLRVKETDRLAALQTELTKLGARVQIDGDDLIIEPPAGGRVRPATIDTYDDHRIAMSFTVVGLAAEGIVINDPDCVNKTFPDFFQYLKRLETHTS